MGIALPWWIIRWDQRRLPEDQLARTWTEASFWAAVVTFGPLCIPVHFVKSRRSFKGFLLGALWMAAALVAVSTGSWLFDRALGIP